MSTLPAWVATAVDGLPPRPDDELDVYLDATEECIRRYGWSRTSPQDIAREAGVNRTTIYRVLGPKKQIFDLWLSREVHRMIDRAVRLAATFRAQGTPGPDAIVELMASEIEHLRSQPTTAKLLADEPELIAEFMRDAIPGVIERFAQALGPLLGSAMDAGLVAQRDPYIATQWTVRMGLSLLFAPPKTDLRAFLDAGIRPLFAVG